MDTNLVFAFLTLLIIALIVSEIEEAILLFILGIVIIAISWNLETAFVLTDSSYSGFGNLIILGFWLCAIFCFGKAGITGYEGIAIYRSRKKV